MVGVGAVFGEEVVFGKGEGEAWKRKRKVGEV